MAQIYPQEKDTPVQPVVDEKYCSETLVSLTVWKKSMFFSGDGFTVYDSSGNLVFRVDNYTPNAKDDLVLMDPHGKSLLTLRPKVPSLHQRWEGFLGDKHDGQKPLFTVRRSSILPTSTSVEVFMSSGFINFWNNCDYQIEGSFSQRCCTIYTCTRRTVAEVRRKCVSSGMMLGKDVFSLLVEPGFDRAFVMGLIIVLDNISRDENDLLRLVVDELRGSQRAADHNDDGIKRVACDVQVEKEETVEDKTCAGVQ